MGYDVKVLGLATSFGDDADLTDAEVAILAQGMQDWIEEEIEYIIFKRKAPDATDVSNSDAP